MRWLARKPAETASTVTSAAAARALPRSDFVCIDRKLWHMFFNNTRARKARSALTHV
ncbi:hypothetical protein chmu117 [Choristoneura murinana nucleopolyhedrovirus]|uniref:Uncharacterized protein n=1 Tax=Choristoneura murinana nucleopolyhedrovirus TaxID=1987479 RepID=V9XVH0_9ABAC|nr:hypothetical protein chmu117 [Choristoneura murinana nucleopolyhedrovirus]AHD25603.1 hypothetical protein chmu117 [Choristoneura murinana nucleopolyhedrovirus]